MKPSLKKYVVTAIGVFSYVVTCDITQAGQPQRFYDVAIIEPTSNPSPQNNKSVLVKAVLTPGQTVRCDTAGPWLQTNETGRCAVLSNTADKMGTVYLTRDTEEKLSVTLLGSTAAFDAQPFTRTAQTIGDARVMVETRPIYGTGD